MLKAMILILTMGWLVNTQAANGDAILGIWETQNGESKVEIFQCQSNYCGKIVWLKFPVYPQDDARGMAGQTKIDRENPDESLRKRPLLNATILEGLVYQGENKWEEGNIYDPKNGKTYRCRVSIENGTLQVRGFIGVSLFGRTAVWTRK